MTDYRPMEFMLMLFELDGLIQGDFSDTSFRGNPPRQLMYLTVRALTRIWEIPSPERLLRHEMRPDALGVLIEARRALAIIFSRRRGYMCGVSPELEMSLKVCGMLTPSRLALDRMIIDYLGIKGKSASENEVVRNGGCDREILESFMVDYL